METSKPSAGDWSVNEDLIHRADEYVCVIEICKGFCCEHISGEVKKNLVKLGLKFEPGKDGGYRCLAHNKETGLCDDYDNRTWYCAWFYCPSAKRGFMASALEVMSE